MNAVMPMMTDLQVSDRLDRLRDGISSGHLLVIIPDGTRTAPMPLLFRLLCEKLHRQVDRITFLIAQGTHPLMSPGEIEALLGISRQEWERQFPNVEVVNHRWDLPETFASAGELTAAETGALSSGRLSVAVPIRVNRLLLEADTCVIVGPVFPHEVAGFSGGSKYICAATAPTSMAWSDLECE
jgi:nickel-dependent lactate racemase